ncbi:MAG TPA: TetR/AcrR family transcriptional regulator [Ignavibacteriaceae bacterium]|nr:TetR/AcrR family transcriptional regulator [Ignavibacteriaceae bacterium]
MTEQLSTEKHDMILRAARKRFAYYGFSKVTMDEIAADVGMGKASLYYYFPTKESLFHEVIKHESEQFFSGINSMLTEKIPACKMFRSYAGKRLEHFRTLVNLRALSLQQSAETRISFLELYKDFHKQEVEILQQIFQLGKKNGEFSVTNPQQTAEVILQMFYGSRAWFFKVRENSLDEETYNEMESAMKSMIEIIINGISKRK